MPCPFSISPPANKDPSKFFFTGNRRNTAGRKKRENNGDSFKSDEKWNTWTTRAEMDMKDKPNHDAVIKQALKWTYYKNLKIESKEENQEKEASSANSWRIASSWGQRGRKMHPVVRETESIWKDNLKGISVSVKRGARNSIQYLNRRLSLRRKRKRVLDAPSLKIRKKTYFSFPHLS